VLTALLDKYADEGVSTLENAKVLRLEPFKEMGTPVEIINTFFGGKDKFESAVHELEQELFRQEESA
jgi:type I restriction enzyme R subunit